MNTSLKRMAISALVLPLMLAACGTQPTVTDIATLTPLPSATHLIPTDIPTPTVEPTVAATVTPSVPYPITWIAEAATGLDGRKIYRVNDPTVIQAARQGYERLREYYLFPNGLPPKEQLTQDLAQLILDPDRIRGAVDQLEKVREGGGYWIQPPLSIYKWTDKSEFNEDGSQVNMVMMANVYHANFFSLKAGKITYSEEDKGFMAEVTMAYDQSAGVWKVLVEKTSTAEKGPVVTVTPAP